MTRVAAARLAVPRGTGSLLAALLVAMLTVAPVIDPTRTASELVYTTTWWLLPLVLGSAGVLLLTCDGLDRLTGVAMLGVVALPLTSGIHALAAWPMLALMAVRVWCWDARLGIIAVVLAGALIGGVAPAGLPERVLFLMWAVAVARRAWPAHVPR